MTPHRDVDAVDAALRSRDEQRAVVVTDSVFSADGSLARFGSCLRSAGVMVRCFWWTRRTAWVCVAADAGCSTS